MKYRSTSADLLQSLTLALTRIVRSTTNDSALFDDLMQEALFHRWLMEIRRPGQTVSWYLQSCKFHLRNYLVSGRSVDSAKRGSGHVQLDVDSGIMEEALKIPDSEGSVLSSVCARDLLSLLSRRLPARDTAILYCLAEGLGSREIGRRFNLSHTTVIKCRRKIAALLTRLEAPFRSRRPGSPNDFERNVSQRANSNSASSTLKQSPGRMPCCV